MAEIVCLFQTISFRQPDLEAMQRAMEIVVLNHAVRWSDDQFQALIDANAQSGAARERLRIRQMA